LATGLLQSAKPNVYLPMVESCMDMIPMEKGERGLSVPAIDGRFGRARYRREIRSYPSSESCHS